MSDDAFFDRYADLDLQRRMVSDRRRTQAFCRAVERVVEPGMRVLDVGCGTGILALAAARAGAQVVAIDRADVVRSAARVAKANGMQSHIRFLEGDVRGLEGERFDGIVSEWLGNFAFVEDMWSDVADARDRMLEPGGWMLPERVRLWLAPVDDSVLFYGDGPGAWTESVEGFDFSPLEQAELDQGLAHQLRVDRAALVADPVCLLDLDLTTASMDAATCEGELEFRFQRPAFVHGFVGWFDVCLAGEWFSTGPDHPETHWAQTYLPTSPGPSTSWTQPLRWTLSPDPDERRHLILQLLGHDTRLAFRLE